MGLVDLSILIFCSQWWMVRLKKRQGRKMVTYISNVGIFKIYFTSCVHVIKVDIRPHFVCLHKNYDDYFFLYAWKLLSYRLFFCLSSLSHSLCFVPGWEWSQWAESIDAFSQCHCGKLPSFNTNWTACLSFAFQAPLELLEPFLLSI